MPEALGAVFPATTLQTCIVHLIRHSLHYANWKEHKPLAAALKPIYQAPSAEPAEAALGAFEAGPWSVKCPTVVASWRQAWSQAIPFFAFPAPIRKLIYTTNAIESVNAQLRKSHRAMSAEVLQTFLSRKPRAWYWTGDDGKVYIGLKYATKTLEIAKGKSDIEIDDAKQLAPMIEALKRAVAAGELDAQIDAAGSEVGRRFLRSDLNRCVRSSRLLFHFAQRYLLNPFRCFD